MAIHVCYEWPCVVMKEEKFKDTGCGSGYYVDSKDKLSVYIVRHVSSKIYINIIHATLNKILFV